MSFRPARFWPALALVAWGLLISVIAVEAYLKPRGRTVFDIYAVAGRAWWTDAADLYARQPETHEFYRYSPLFAVGLAPFVAVPPGLGNALWKIVNVLVFLAGFHVWCRRASPIRLSQSQIAAVFLLMLPGAMTSAFIGQAHLMMMGFTFLAVAAIHERRWWLAGGCLAAATLIKVYPIALAGVLCVLFVRHLAIPYLSSLALGLGLPFLTASPSLVLERNRHWLSHLVESNELNRDRFRSLARLAEILEKPIDAKVFFVIGALAGLALLLACCAFAWRRRVLSRDPCPVLFLATASTTLWMLLFLPSTENVTYGILAPILAWGVVQSFTTPGRWIERSVLLLALFLTGPAITDLVGPGGRSIANRIAAPVIGGVLAGLWLIVWAIRTPSASATPPASQADSGLSPARPGPDRIH